MFRRGTVRIFGDLIYGDVYYCLLRMRRPAGVSLMRFMHERVAHCKKEEKGGCIISGTTCHNRLMNRSLDGFGCCPIEVIMHIMFLNGDDEKEHFTWVKFLRSKDEALGLHGTDLSIKLYVAIMKMSVSLMKHLCKDLGKLKAKVNVGIFIGYAPIKKAYRIYNRCTKQIMETIHVDFDVLTAMASKQSSSGPTLHEMTPATLKSRLVPKLTSTTPFVPPTRIDWDTLFQMLFDEYFSPPPFDQDAPSPSTSQTPQESPSHVIPLVAEKANHDIEVAHMDNNPHFSIPILEPSYKESSSQVVVPNNVDSVNQPPEHISKWTKDHPINNVIGDPCRPVSTRQQLQTKALLCYFDAFLSSVKPKSYKEALTESCWIEAMQEELNEFERLDVWELVPRPDHVMIITLKWIL
ncbi:retrovirus-related pol polyprotein from transposon TNT 1-94 [Tanacetum coccineum]